MKHSKSNLQLHYKICHCKLYTCAFGTRRIKVQETRVTRFGFITVSIMWELKQKCDGSLCNCRACLHRRGGLYFVDAGASIRAFFPLLKLTSPFVAPSCSVEPPSAPDAACSFCTSLFRLGVTTCTTVGCCA